ncbi:MAG TPA: VWA domain-containing protein [Gaiellaceae bacterium]|jgi:tight adherence protein B|nr:VWA domain-containing protein [Gaiellaceae bacterium]
MSWTGRKRIHIRVGIVFGAAALGAVPAASAGVKLNGVDATAYPRVRMTLVSPLPVSKAPRVTENGKPVSGLRAENLGRAKSVALLVDRSQSMKGQPFANAVSAAQAFLRAKSSQDRVAVGTFATKPVMLTDFSPTAADAQAALRSLSVDKHQGTTLYDCVVKAARSFSSEGYSGRVVIVVTDGNETRSTATLDNAIKAARESGVLVYVVAIESKQFRPAPLKRLAAETGGSYRGAESSKELSSIYAGIAQELRRTWRVEYLTAARSGEKLALQATLPGAGSARASLTVPEGASAPAVKGPSGLLPRTFYESFFGTQLMGLIVGLLVLLAGTFVVTSVRGSRLRRRLAPHLGETKGSKRKADDRERLQAAAGLFRATERTFGHWRHWIALDRMLERADLPLRTVEFVYLSIGAGLLGGLVGAALLSGVMVFAAMAGAAAVPFSVVWFKGHQRTKAFENQLPDLLITLAAALKAGHSFKQGLQTVVDEGRPPASKELKRVLTEAQLGRPIDEALQEMAVRLGSKNFEFVITAVSIQRQVGGSLAGLIDMVADTVRQRQQFIRKVRGLTAMGRAGSYVLIGLPFVIAAAITLMNSDYMAPLYYSSAGHKIMLLGFSMMAVGSLLLKKIVSFKG